MERIVETGNQIVEELDYMDGAVKLYRRNIRGEFNPVWQAIIKTPSSKGRLRKSLKTKSLEDAKRLAREEYIKAEGRVQQGLPLNPIRFEDAAIEYTKWIKDEHARGAISENIVSQHTSITNSFLKPYFKETYLHNIKARDLEAYYAQRKRGGATRQGQTIRAGTINKDNAVIRGIFDYCKREGYIKEIPPIKNQHAFAQRPSFSREEAKILQRKLDEWVSIGEQESSLHIRDYRLLFRLYCMIIYYSGIRPGEEMKSLRWENISFERQGKIEYVRLSRVKSAKQKKQQEVFRPVVALPDLWRYFEELKDYPHLSPERGWVFQHPHTTQQPRHLVGKQIGSFKAQWENFIKWADLECEISPPHRRRTLYSLRHLYFETRLIYGDVKLHELAINGGTSPEVIMKWYQEAQATQFAESLSGVIRKTHSD